MLTNLMISMLLALSEGAMMYVCTKIFLSLEERASTFQVFGFLIHGLGPKLSSDILRLHVACISVRF